MGTLRFPIPLSRGADLYLHDLLWKGYRFASVADLYLHDLLWKGVWGRSRLHIGIKDLDLY